MANIRIIAKRNGPLMVIVDGKPRIALCRCGHSGNKPFCDGSHARFGFNAEEKTAWEYEC